MTITDGDAATGTEAEPYDVMLTREARQVFRRAVNMSPEWAGTARGAIGEAVWDLGVALKVYDDLRCGILPAYLPGLPTGQGALAKAIQRAAEDAEERAADVVRVIAGHRGEEAAASVSGTEGEEGQ